MAEGRRPRIGIIGGGTIAGAIVGQARATGFAVVDYVLVSALGKARGDAVPAELLLDDVDEALARPVDLVVEAATPDVLAALAPQILRRSSLCGFSCTALAEPATDDAIRDAADRSGFRFHVPHGAVLGLDGLADGRNVIDTVVVTTTKSGKSLGLDADASGVLFDGPAREACRRFPRNVNVHAAIALAGIGFERTRSRIVAAPDTATMEHRIEVAGKGLAWDISVASQSLGGVTGSYTPVSAAGSVRRILAGAGVDIA